MNTRESREFFEALDFISKEKGISSEVLAEKLKGAIVLAVRKQYHGVDNINVVMDTEKCKFNVSFSKLVVDEVHDPSNEILLEAALAHSKRARIGELVEIKVDSKHIGRIAAQAAKQQIMQIIRDVEKESLTEKMGDKVGDIITATVERVEPASQNVVLKVDNNEIVLFRGKQLPNDEFEPGDIVKVYAVYISSESKGSPLKVSRTHPNFIRRLFELEVPEINEGKIEIKKIAREAGVRTKIAVSTNDPSLEPVGCCIGNKGIRVSSIVNELGGEKIDVIKYSDDPREFVVGALSPASVSEIELLDEPNMEKVAFVSVPETQISLAIGNRGLNAKLAAMITGFKIDISPESGFYGEDSKNTLKEKLIARLEQQNQKQKEKAEKLKQSEKSPEELLEEADIHAFEVEDMLEEIGNQQN